MTAGENERAHDVESQAELVTHLRVEASKLITELDGRVRSVQVDAGGCAVRVEWADAQVAALPPETPVHPSAHPAGNETAAGDAAPAVQSHAVCAPLVGTFYRRSSPEAAPFVEVGDVVEAGQTLAIVEAMKLMNEIKADRPGRVSTIGPEDGDMVEFGQVLIELSTD